VSIGSILTCDSHSPEDNGQADSPFFRLPTHLRYRVYNYALRGYQIRVKRLSDPANRDEDDVTCNYTISWPFEESEDPFSPLLNLPAACRQLRTEAKNLPYSICYFVVNFADLEVFSNALPNTVRSNIKLLHMPLLFMPESFDSIECSNMLANLGCFPALEKIWVTSLFSETSWMTDLLIAFAKGIRLITGRDTVVELADFDQVTKP
jgi:hypothetical protein